MGDGPVTTFSKDPRRCHGTRDSISLRHLMPLNHQRDQFLSHLDFPSRMSTRSLVSELYQSVESRPVSSSQISQSSSVHSVFPPMSSPFTDHERLRSSPR